ncbi:Fungal specific transcription factor domain-containing protein [Cladophialophora immunda]|nr:Fungal specific transcription factor domain-containing protein [Cladophialophora immunda]
MQWRKEPRGTRHSRAATLLAPNIASTDWVNVDSRINPGPNLSTAALRDDPPEAAAAATKGPQQNGRNGQRESERESTQPQGDQQLISQALSPNAPMFRDNQGQTPQSTIDTETSSPRESVFERNTNFMTGTAFFQQIDLLDRSVTRAQGTDLIKVGGFLGSSSFEPNTSVADIYRDIDQTVEQARVEDPTKVHRSLDMFFANVQPHYPCMNEGYLRAQFSAFVANDPNCLTKNGSVQLAALLQFIMAVVSILCDNSTQGQYLPGWKEFCRGDKLLSHATWLERANIVTIQTLLVKTLYFMYAGLLNSAYDTMGTAVRLCFQLGLHNEPSWGEECKFYDRTYRQRVFWSVFCLNHNVAQTRGVPELLRESDINVGLPKCVDDRMLYPDCPSLPEMPTTSPVPYLLETIKLTRLSSEVWEAMFGARAKKPVSQDFIAAMDNKIIELSREIPPSLSWPPAAGSQHMYDGAPSFIQQQGFILHLRILYLRMLLRREEMISLAYGRKVARLCIDMATEVVAAVDASYSSQRSKRCERHAYLHHLTGALVPMICIIVKQNNSEDLTRPAINLLNKSLKIMESFSQGSFLARRILQQLRRPIKVARDIIESQWPQSVRAGTASNTIATALGPAPNSTWNSGNVNANGDWDLSLPTIYQEPFQDPLQKTSDMPFLWDDSSVDLWNNFNWSG